MRGVLAAAVGPHVAVVALDGVVGVEVLQVGTLRVAERGGGGDEGVLGAGADVGALGDVDGARVAVGGGVAGAVVGFELLEGGGGLSVLSGTEGEG